MVGTCHPPASGRSCIPFCARPGARNPARSVRSLARRPAARDGRTRYQSGTRVHPSTTPGRAYSARVTIRDLFVIRATRSISTVCLDNGYPAVQESRRRERLLGALRLTERVTHQCFAGHAAGRSLAPISPAHPAVKSTLLDVRVDSRYYGARSLYHPGPFDWSH